MSPRPGNKNARPGRDRALRGTNHVPNTSCPRRRSSTRLSSRGGWARSHRRFAGPKPDCLLFGCFAAKRTLILARRSALSEPKRTPQTDVVGPYKGEFRLLRAPPPGAKPTDRPVQRHGELDDSDQRSTRIACALLLSVPSPEARRPAPCFRTLDSPRSQSGSQTLRLPGARQSR